MGSFLPDGVFLHRLLETDPVATQPVIPPSQFHFFYWCEDVEGKAIRVSYFGTSIAFDRFLSSSKIGISKDNAEAAKSKPTDGKTL